MIDNYPNFLMIPEAPEKPEDIVEDYVEMIMSLKDDENIVRELLHDFFDDVNYWTVRQMLIDQAKVSLQHLKELEECEHEFVEDLEDDC